MNDILNDSAAGARLRRQQMARRLGVLTWLNARLSPRVWAWLAVGWFVWAVALAFPFPDRVLDVSGVVTAVLTSAMVAGVLMLVSVMVAAVVAGVFIVMPHRGRRLAAGEMSAATD